MPDPRPSSPPEPSSDPTLPFGPLTMALGEPIRWAILRELASRPPKRGSRCLLTISPLLSGI